MTLLLSGFRETFDLETTRIVEDFGAAGFVVRETADSPFASGALLPTAVADELVASGAVGQADPIVTARQPITSPRREEAYVIGHRPGGMAEPTPTEGRVAAASGEVVVDRGTGYELGETFQLGGATFTVVGRVQERSLFFGRPLVYVLLEDAQRAAFAGQPLATAILVDRADPFTPAGYRVIEAEEAQRDMTRILGPAVTTVEILKVFLWAVAAAIIASVLYVSVLERSRDLAVFKAIGVGTGPLGAALALQAVGLALLAAGTSCVVALLVRPVFPVPISLPAAVLGRLAAVAVVVGLLAALAGLRRSMRIEPAAAFQAA